MADENKTNKTRYIAHSQKNANLTADRTYIDGNIAVFLRARTPLSEGEQIYLDYDDLINRQSKRT